MTETKMQLVDWLDDLCVRFIINLPQEELESVERICFQVEEAQWFYEDFIRPLDPDLPSLNLRNFCLRIFQHCPLLSQFSSYHHSTAFSEFLAYKTRVPVRGAIMLNHEMDSVVLVKGWKKGASWSFPRGKINKDEPDLECAIREVYEETGFDIHEARLVASNNVKSIEVTMREQHMRLYVFRGVPMDAHFEAKTRKEISKIQWYKLSDLPTLRKGKNQQQEGKGDELANNANKFYMVAPFLNPLKKWISQQRKLEKREADGHLQPEAPPNIQEPEETRMALAADGVLSATNLNKMERLLAGLRQSRQVTGNITTPELFQSLDPGAEQAVPRQPPMQNVRDNPESRISQPSIKEPTGTVGSGVDRERSKALFALLKGENITREGQLPPQTPIEQVIEHPVMPPSPKYHYPPAGRDRTVPLVSPIGHISSHHDSSLEVQQPLGQSTSTSPLKSIPQSGFPPSRQPFPPSFAGATAGRQSHPHQVPNTRSTQPNQTALPAPYRRVGDPMSAQASQFSRLPSSIPAASKLPPPKLTSHSSALLNLFKAGKSAKAPSEVSAVGSSTSRGGSPKLHRITSHLEKGEVSGVDDVSSATDQELIPTSRGSVFEVPASNRLVGVQSKTGRAASNILGTGAGPQTPVRPEGSYANIPKVQPATPPPPAIHSKNVTEPAYLRTTHQATLLNLFRKPSALPSEDPKGTKLSLEPPPKPFELSAVPSPGHSREPSHTDGLRTVQPIGDMSHILPFSSTTQTKAARAPRKTTISATVDGPLNVHQFDMLAKKSPNLVQNGTPSAPQNTPVQILSRPPQPLTAAVPSTTNGARKIVNTKPAPPRDKPSTSAPREQAATATSHFQPQILRRPPHIQPSQPDSLLSPIEPLPSPKHPVGRGKQSSDHKASLLSLFTKPSPTITPTHTPATVDPEALVSPHPIGAPSRPVFEGGKQGASDALPSAGLERSRTGSPAPDVTEGGQTPRMITTPKDKRFLLGYLEGVVRGEKR